ncbi:MAG: helix-turn-helix domain-containing protein [Oscillospiraceae bacterium]|nr:helix-turn-helix domain-containing protein [Oscillospiraceae bacterium]
MAAKTVGELIKEARTAAKLSQQALAEQIEGLSASDVSKAERGEKELTQAQLKAIAKATGVTQKSLLEAAAAKKPAASTAAKKPAASAKKPASTSAAKKPASTAAKKAEEITLTAAEKKLLELYRAADSDTKKAAVAVLKGEKPEDSGVLGSLLNMIGGTDVVGGLLGSLKK